MFVTCGFVGAGRRSGCEAAGQRQKVCPRTESHLTYMINIALTTEFTLDDSAR